MGGIRRLCRGAKRTGHNTSRFSLLICQFRRFGAISVLKLTSSPILYRSFWTLTGSPSLLRHPELQAIARSKGSTPAQVLYRFAQTQGITPLTGTTSETHMQEDLNVEKIDLTAAEVESLVQYVWQ